MRALLISSDQTRQQVFAAVAQSIAVDSSVVVANDVIDALSILADDLAVDVTLVPLDEIDHNSLSGVASLLPNLMVFSVLGDDACENFAEAVMSVSLPRSIVDESAAQTHGVSVAARKACTSLTRRQRDVLRLIAAGHSTKRIASQLKISVGTVKAHTAAIFRHLGVRNRTQAANVGQKAWATLGLSADDMHSVPE